MRARETFRLVAPETPEGRMIIKAALERSDGLRERLSGKLDAIDTDANLSRSLVGCETRHSNSGPIAS